MNSIPVRVHSESVPDPRGTTDKRWIRTVVTASDGTEVWSATARTEYETQRALIHVLAGILEALRTDEHSTIRQIWYPGGIFTFGTTTVWG